MQLGDLNPDDIADVKGPEGSPSLDTIDHNDIADVKPPVDPTLDQHSGMGSYTGVPNDQLNWAQRAERAMMPGGGHWFSGIVKPGSEMISPSALHQKKLGLETAANTATMGYLPQMYGALKSGAVSGDNYLKNRDEMSQELASAPLDTKLSGMALGVLPTLASGSVLPAAKSIPGRIGQTAALGAAQGFASNPGDTPGEYNPTQMDARLHNAEIGGATGAATSTLANIPAMRDYFKKQANFRALKQSGAMLRDLRGIENSPGNSIEDAGQMLLTPQEAGPNGKIQVVTPGANLQDVADRSQQLMQVHGERIGQVQDLLDKNFDKLKGSRIAPDLFHPHEVADRLEQEIIAPTLGTKMEDATNEVQSVVEDLRRMPEGPATFSDAKRQLQGIDQFVKFSSDQSPQKELLKRARGIINGEIEGAVDAVGQASNFPLYDKWKESKKIYGTMKNVNEMANDKIFRDQSNRFVSPSDYFTAGTGSMVGHAAMGPAGIVAGAGAGVANHLLRKYGNAVASNAANGMANAMASPSAQQASSFLNSQMPKIVTAQQQVSAAMRPETVIPKLTANPQTAPYGKSLQEAAQKGQDAYAARYYLLAQSYPDFRAAMNGGTE